MGAILGTPWARDPLKRRLTVVVAAVVLAVLCVWPRHYMARADLMPDDSGGGLSSLLGAASGGSGGGLLSLGALIGNHQSIEADLTIARSQAVLNDVVRALRLQDRPGFGDAAHAQAKLRRKVDIESIRGSILQITIRDSDPAFAKALVGAFATAIRGRLTILNLQQAAQKKAVADNRMRDAVTNLASAQAAMDSFRAANKLAAPEIQLGAAVVLVTNLQGRLQAARAQLEALRQFATADSIQVQATAAEVSSLQAEIAAAQNTANNGAGPSLGAMSPKISQYETLYRNEKYAEAAYEIYKRYLETVSVDELSATTNMDLIEPPYINPARQYNVQAVGALILVLLLGVMAEFYIARPPVGRR
jgi:capsule polysaccharide export protein KpsE/RkpR